MKCSSGTNCEMIRVKVSMFLANIYLIKVNNRNTRKKCEICSELTMKTQKRRH